MTVIKNNNLVYYAIFIPLKPYFTKAPTREYLWKTGCEPAVRVIYILPSLEAVQVSAMYARLKIVFLVEL